MVQYKLRDRVGRVSRERLPLGPAHPFRPLRIDGELYGEGHGLLVALGIQRHAALQVSQPGMAFTATKGTLAVAASVLVSPPGLESITSAARMYTGT